MYITLCPRELYTYFAQLNWFEALEKTYICLCKEANEWMDVVEHATSSKAALNANAIPFVPDAVVNETMHISNGSKAIPSLLSAHTDSLVPDVNQPPNSSMSSRSEQRSAIGKVSLSLVRLLITCKRPPCSLLPQLLGPLNLMITNHMQLPSKNCYATP